MNYDEWLIEFGKRLRIERERQLLTRNKLAKRAKTAQDYIAQIERGSKSPSLRTFMNILLALGVSADSIIFGFNHNEQNSYDASTNELIKYLSKRDDDIKFLIDITKLLSKYKIFQIEEK